MATRFKATKEELARVFATAVNASKSAGMGFIHYQSKDYAPEDFAGVQSVDYFDGRMVKLYPRSVEDGVYELRDPKYDANDMERTYQSWGGTYPTALALIEAAGLHAEP